MKRNIIAVASLLLATSALAGASAAQDKDHKPVILASKAMNSPVTAKDTVISAKSAEATAMKKEMAYSGMGGPLEEVDDASIAGKPILAEKPVETDPIVLAKYEEAAALKSAQTQTGVGGPFEDANAGTVDLAPRPATQDYPPCSPGPGDDRCIQLYEPGVRAQLASWNRGGGLADSSVKTAMGGPLEPVEASWKGKAGMADSSAATAMGGPYEPVEDSMNGDGSDAKLAEIGDQSGDVEIASHHAFKGVGGPIEAQSGYPACSPGPGDDRCIQLYEPGVTGAGN
ncbi:MAG TPA: hypothetical protein VFO69_11875 [Allosphingosinicella sp.]|nr:hypothetical protein [Allosphingosinicella sp.]